MPAKCLMEFLEEALQQIFVKGSVVDALAVTFF